MGGGAGGGRRWGLGPVNEPEPAPEPGRSFWLGLGLGLRLGARLGGQNVYRTVGYAANPEALALVAYT